MPLPVKSNREWLYLLHALDVYVPPPPKVLWLSPPLKMMLVGGRTFGRPLGSGEVVRSRAPMMGLVYLEEKEE